MGFINWIKEVLDIEDHKSAEMPHETMGSDGVVGMDGKEFMLTEPLPMTDEEKELVAVIASCIVGKDKPDIQLHIQKITRVE